MHRLLLGLALLASLSHAEPLPEDEVQVSLSSYVDSFDVLVIYPSIAVSRRIEPSTAISGHYLVDAVTSASMKSRIPVDGVTSATRRTHGGSGGGLDELRHELGLRATRVAGEATVSADAIYSTERDYRSLTLAGTGGLSLARRNTELSVSLLRGWDEVFPVTRDWRRRKNTVTWDASVTQVLGPRAIAQGELTYSELDGYLADAYQVVTVRGEEPFEFVRYEPRHPDRRVRRAAGLRTNLRTTDASALRLGFRYYWDTWGVRSSTWEILAQHHLLARRVTLGAGLRTYAQTSADFFRPVYTEPERYMTVDGQLDSSHANEYRLRVRVAGELLHWLPGLGREGSELTARASYYHRRTTTANWHSRRKTLDALITSLAIRVPF